MSDFEQQINEYLYGQTDEVQLLQDRDPVPLPDNCHYCRVCGFIGTELTCEHCGENS